MAERLFSFFGIFIQFVFYPVHDLVKGFLDLGLRLFYGLLDVLLSLLGGHEIVGYFHDIIDG
jgi:hypothetical protein